MASEFLSGEVRDSQVSTEYPLQATLLGPRFVDPLMDRIAQTELAEVCRRALGTVCKVTTFTSILTIAIANRLMEVPMGSLLVATLFAHIGFNAVALLALRAQPAALQHRVAFLYAMGIVLLSATIVPMACLAMVGIELLAVWGYFGPTIALLLIAFLLRLPFRQAAMLAIFTVAAYTITTANVDGFDRYRSLHVVSVTIVAAAVCIGAWLLEQSMRQGVAQRKIIADREQALAEEHARAEKLLLNILPVPIARRLQNGESPIADHAEAVTVVFADLVGFTPLASTLPPDELVRLLDSIFRRFDACAADAGMEKVKTIGDAYFAVAGLPSRTSDHAAMAARFSLGMLSAIEELGCNSPASLSIRIGLESGPVVAGVIGSHKFAFDLWGDTVNTAARMESHGEPGRIHVGERAARLLQSEFELEARGPIEIKGKGRVSTWWLNGQRPAATLANGTETRLAKRRCD